MTTLLTELILRWTLGVLLLVSSLEKARRPVAFAAAVDAYRMVPHWLGTPIAFVLIATEAVVGLALMSGFTPTIAAAAAVALFSAFTFAVGTNLARGNIVPCHCFGSRDSDSIGKLTFVRSLLLTGLSGLLLGLATTATNNDLSRSLLLPAALMAVTIATFVRVLPLIADSWEFLRTPATILPTTARRSSFKFQPWDASLRSTPSPNRHGHAASSTIDVFRAKGVER